ncbi:hypothetical protein QUB80_27765 [Chlorogloeopsis sp. ULAP01]|uniref:hypothetical protein n=1 Tax=Chlorogloeopsis sp. ULAP01 TaxID=3056483 RepID=UPI0025AA85FD|nr:hypothetical protein [Chlorogloeopsis sp. ULAP01]MDM9384468.1 hypothetical protein [Chlorogloeopsis sp. ULAP01]
MNIIYPKGKRASSPVSLLLTGLLTLSLFTGCGSSQTATPPPPVEDIRGGRVSPPPPVQRSQTKKGLSNTQKVAILAGAAALYYLYNKHKNSQNQGPQGKYYLSKNGRVYYRDAQGRAHWVTPPPEGIRVPEAEARQYRDFQGYNGRPTGRDLTDLQPGSSL